MQPFLLRCKIAKEWFRTGLWPEEIQVPVFTEVELLDKFVKKSRKVNKRHNTAIPGWSPKVSGEELLNLYEAGNRRCKFSDLTAHIHNTEVVPFWALSIDHVDPVEGTTIDELYGLKNLQIMISDLNSVKGNYSDEELREWFDLVKKSL